MKAQAVTFLAAGFVIAIVAGCASSGTTVVDRNRAGTVQRVEMGTVLHVKNIVLSGDQTAIGIMGGGLVGHAVGGGVGQGTGRAIASTAGAVAGAVAGRKVEEVATRKAGIEVMVQLDSGDKVVIVQQGSAAFIVGDRVQVISGAGAAHVVLPGA